MTMNDTTNAKNVYDDGNIPEIDLPRQNRSFEQVTSSNADKNWSTEPLPESTRPRKDGPGGDGND